MSPSRKMLINAADQEEFRVAILEEGMLTEFALEAASREQTKGNIYKGVVANVEPSLQAAFLNYGGNRHGFLPLSEVHPDYYLEKVKDRSKVRIQQALKKGQELIVQVIKEESANKGAYLSTYVSLPGRFLVLLVKQSHLGISRKIEKEEERQRLKELAQKLGVPPEMGVIIRTVGEEGKQRSLGKDLSVLLKLWEDISKAAAKPAPCMLYKDLDVITRTVRDYLSVDVKSILVDDLEVHQQLKSFLRLVSPQQVRALKLYQDKLPLFMRFQIEEQIERLYGERVSLKSGGGLVINPTEALVSIDVNSGRCLSQGNLEETAYKTNVEAAEEIARQLRLRDLGGLVVIDFIDMKDKKHQKAVEQALKACPQNRQGPGHRGAHQQVRPVGALPAAPAPHRRDQHLYPLRLLPGPGPGQVRHRPGALPAQANVRAAGAGDFPGGAGDAPPGGGQFPAQPEAQRPPGPGRAVSSKNHPHCPTWPAPGRNPV